MGLFSLCSVLYMHGSNLQLVDNAGRAIGGRATQFPDAETYKKVQVDYTLAAARSFLEKLVPSLPEGRQFRFVFCSGKFAEWDQKKALHFMADTRHVKVRTWQCWPSVSLHFWHGIASMTDR